MHTGRNRSNANISSSLTDLSRWYSSHVHQRATILLDEFVSSPVFYHQTLHRPLFFTFSILPANGANCTRDFTENERRATELLRWKSEFRVHRCRPGYATKLGNNGSMSVNLSYKIFRKQHHLFPRFFYFFFLNSSLFL